MNEHSSIIGAFELLCGEGKPSALATVVSVSGSAYRRPGARMLIAEDGRTWGGVSGGCLERDVARRARGGLASGRSVVCRYETTDNEDLSSGAATGCRGTVDLFIEPLSRSAPGPIPWLIRSIRERRSVAVATILRTSAAGDGRGPGARISLDENDIVEGRFEDPALRSLCLDALSDGAMGELAKRVQYRAAGVTTDVFIERLSPPQELVIFGGGPDAVPVVSMAKLMGWRVTVVGVRPATGLAQRFAQADTLHVTPPGDPLAGVEMTPESAVVLMTHNYPRDIGILAGLPLAPRYLGILGPRSRTEELFAELGADLKTPLGAMAPAIGPRQHGQTSTLVHGTHCADSASPTLQRVYAPIGLDLGAETPEQIALSIVAEIQAVLRSTEAGFLRDRQGPIHRQPVGKSDFADGTDMQRVWREVACPM